MEKIEKRGKSRLILMSNLSSKAEKLMAEKRLIIIKPILISLVQEETAIIDIRKEGARVVIRCVVKHLWQESKLHLAGQDRKIQCVGASIRKVLLGLGEKVMVNLGHFRVIKVSVGHGANPVESLGSLEVLLVSVGHGGNLVENLDRLEGLLVSLGLGEEVKVGKDHLGRGRKENLGLGKVQKAKRGLGRKLRAKHVLGKDQKVESLGLGRKLKVRRVLGKKPREDLRHGKSLKVVLDLGALGNLILAKEVGIRVDKAG
ncbi:MAG: hypothetical protein HZC15_03915 [Candidatus Omnitrophica bacterium]|nr:hypothetical protein [Candidatus Omnitrophota bacterium]